MSKSKGERLLEDATIETNYGDPIVTREDLVDLAGGDDLVFWDGCDDALVGVGSRCSQKTVAVYDYERMIQCFMEDMTREDAEEWVAFNILGAWVGEKTPIILFTGREE